MGPAVPQKKAHADDNAHISNVEYGPYAEVKKINDSTVAEPIQRVAESAAQEQAHTGLHGPMSRYSFVKQSVQDKQDRSHTQEKPLLVLQHAKGSAAV